MNGKQKEEVIIIKKPLRVIYQVLIHRTKQNQSISKGSKISVLKEKVFCLYGKLLSNCCAKFED